MDNLLTSCSVESSLLFGPGHISEDDSEAGNVCLLADDDRSVKDLKWYTALSEKYHEKIQI